MAEQLDQLYLSNNSDKTPVVSDERCESPIENNFGDEMLIQEVRTTTSEPPTITEYSSIGNSMQSTSLREPTESEDFSLLSLQVNGASRCFDPTTERKFADLPALSEGQMRMMQDRCNMHNDNTHYKFEHSKDVTTVVQALQERGKLRQEVQVFDECLHRPDIARAVRELNGPRVPRETSISRTRHSLRHRLILALSVERDDLKDWRLLAEYLGYDDYIKLWQQKYRFPAEPMFNAWSIRLDATVGNLFDFLIRNDMGTIADIL